MNKQYVVKSGGYETTISAYNMQDARIRAKTAKYVSKGQKFTVTRVKRRNPSGGRKLTKAQKREKTRKVSAKRRVAIALGKFLRAKNPGKRYAGAKMQSNPGGSITIIPVKLPKGRK